MKINTPRTQTLYLSDGPLAGMTVFYDQVWGISITPVGPVPDGEGVALFGPAITMAGHNSMNFGEAIRSRRR